MELYAKQLFSETSGPMYWLGKKKRWRANVVDSQCLPIGSDDTTRYAEELRVKEYRDGLFQSNIVLVCVAV